MTGLVTTPARTRARFHPLRVADVERLTEDAVVVTFRVPPELARFIARKGSIAIDGVSLTVNNADQDSFGVNIISHTAEVTGFSTLKPGDFVNIEIDMLARYVARLHETSEAAHQ